MHQGEDVIARIYAKHPGVHPFYRKPMLWGPLTREPLAVITIPDICWEGLSEREQKALEDFAGTCVEQVKKSPFEHGQIDANAPAAGFVRRNVARMGPRNWGIVVGAISPDGTDVFADRLIRKGLED